jgi:hypothetical protein
MQRVSMKVAHHSTVDLPVWPFDGSDVPETIAFATPTVARQALWR